MIRVVGLQHSRVKTIVKAVDIISITTLMLINLKANMSINAKRIVKEVAMKVINVHLIRDTEKVVHIMAS